MIHPWTCEIVMHSIDAVIPYPWHAMAMANALQFAKAAKDKVDRLIRDQADPATFVRLRSGAKSASLSVQRPL